MEYENRIGEHGVQRSSLQGGVRKVHKTAYKMKISTSM